MDLGWNAPKLPEYLALANGIAGGSNCVSSSEISPRSCLELALSVGRHSPCILPPTKPVTIQLQKPHSFFGKLVDE